MGFFFSYRFLCSCIYESFLSCFWIWGHIFLKPSTLQDCKKLTDFKSLSTHVHTHTHYIQCNSTVVVLLSIHPWNYQSSEEDQRSIHGASCFSSERTEKRPLSDLLISFSQLAAWLREHRAPRSHPLSLEFCPAPHHPQSCSISGEPRSRAEVWLPLYHIHIQLLVDN